MRETRSVLYLHGRGSEPHTPPGDVVASFSWGRPLAAPALTDEWLAGPFTQIVKQVDSWLESSVLAIGHSFGAWLLLCAAVDRATRGVEVPGICLLAPLLGRCFNAKTGVGYFLPRATKVRTALGFDSGRPIELSSNRIRCLHARDDDQASPQDVQTLGALGYLVREVPGGHRLDHPIARTELVDAFASVEATTNFERI